MLFQHFFYFLSHFFFRLGKIENWNLINLWFCHQLFVSKFGGVGLISKLIRCVRCWFEWRVGLAWFEVAFRTHTKIWPLSNYPSPTPNFFFIKIKKIYILEPGKPSPPPPPWPIRNILVLAPRECRGGRAQKNLMSSRTVLRARHGAF